MATSPNSSTIRSASACITPGGGTCYISSSKQSQSISQSPFSCVVVLLRGI
jgi:hypothetical protein